MICTSRPSFPPLSRSALPRSARVECHCASCLDTRRRAGAPGARSPPLCIATAPLPLRRRYVSIGNDANIEALKGRPPMFPEDERAYFVQSIKYVHSAFVCKGSGMLDWTEEVERVQPDLFYVNDDGDRPSKREACARFGIEYFVDVRKPKEGLEARSSTGLKKAASGAPTKALAKDVVTSELNPAKLVYFAGRGLCEPIRWILELGAVPYVNVAITTPEAMDALKASGALTFGQVPLLQMNGVDLVQSRATARYVAEICNLCGQNPEEEAALAIVADGVRDMRRSLTSTPFAEVGGRGAEARAEAAAALAKYAPLFERALAARGHDGPFLTGASRVTYADAALGEALLWMRELLPSEAERVLANAPRVAKLLKGVTENARIAAYLASARRPPLPVGDVAAQYVADVHRVLRRA